MPVNPDTSFVDDMVANVALQFLDRVAESPRAEAFRYPEGETWVSVTWAEAGEQVSRLAAGLLALGLEPEQRVGIASGTCYEWILADLAVMCAGGATTTVYPSTNAEDTSYILGDSECRVVFAEDDEQLAKLKDNKAELPHLAKVVTFDGTTDGDWVIGLDELGTLGDTYLAEHPGVIAKTAQAIDARPARHPDLHLGHHRPPEGCAAAPPLLGLRGLGDPGARHPERGGPRVPLAADGALVRQGAALHPAGNRLPRRHRRPGRQDRRQPGHRTADVHGRRTADLREGVRTDRHHAGGEGRLRGGRLHVGVQGGSRLPQGARRRAAGRGRCCRRSTSSPMRWSSARSAQRFGGRVRFFISGAAALNQEIAEWFHAAGILILEGYGLTESSAGSFVNLPDHYKMGSVGLVFPGSEVRLGDGDEIQIKGPGVMEGYHNLPDETAKTPHRRRLAAHRRQGRARRRRVPDHHRPDQGALQDLRRQVHRSSRDRVEVQGDLPLRQPVRGASATSGTSSSPWSPSTPTHSATGPRRTASAATTPRS